MLIPNLFLFSMLVGLYLVGYHLKEPSLYRLITRQSVRGWHGRYISTRYIAWYVERHIYGVIGVIIGLALMAVLYANNNSYRSPIVDNCVYTCGGFNVYADETIYIELPSATPTIMPTPIINVVKVTTQSEIENIIRQYDWNHEEALAIAKCESGLRANAVGDIGLPDGGPASFGVFQVRQFANRGTPDQLLDVEYNVAKAYEIWSVQKWSPWTCKYVLGM